MINKIIDFYKDRKGKLYNKVVDFVKDKEIKDKKKGRKKNIKRKGKKGEIKNDFIVDTDVQINAIYKSISQNYIFYIAMLCALYAFTKCKYNKSNLFLGGLSIIFITCYGYFVHLISHVMKFKLSETYQEYDNAFTRNKYFNWCAHRWINFAEFHAKTHHDTDVNKTYKNIICEFFNNFITQGGIIILLKYFLSMIDNRVILLWALFYATVHNINYNIVSPLTHQQHHMNDRTNYGIDIWDIIIGSKYEWDTIETHNHTAINIVVITAAIVYFSNKYKV